MIRQRSSRPDQRSTGCRKGEHTHSAYSRVSTVCVYPLCVYTLLIICGRLKGEQKKTERVLRDLDTARRNAAKSDEARYEAVSNLLVKSELVLELRTEVTLPHLCYYRCNSPAVRYDCPQVKLLKSRLKSSESEVEVLNLGSRKKVYEPAALTEAKLQYLESEKLRHRSGVKLGEVQTKLEEERALTKKVCSRVAAKRVRVTRNRPAEQSLTHPRSTPQHDAR